MRQPADQDQNYSSRRKKVTPYIILILTVDMLILIGMTVHGAHQGFARLLSKFIALIASIAVVILISSIVNGYRGENTSNFLTGIILLIVLGAVYKLIHMVVASIRFLACLPILAGIDKILGVIAGFLEGFAILYIGEYLLRMYLLR